MWVLLRTVFFNTDHINLFYYSDDYEMEYIFTHVFWLVLAWFSLNEEQTGLQKLEAGFQVCSILLYNVFK